MRARKLHDRLAILEANARLYAPQPPPMPPPPDAGAMAEYHQLVAAVKRRDLETCAKILDVTLDPLPESQVKIPAPVEAAPAVAVS